jgi:hypothetical protein
MAIFYVKVIGAMVRLHVSVFLPVVVMLLTCLGAAEAADGPIAVSPQMIVGTVKRIPARRYVAAQSCNRRVVRVEKDLLTGELRLRAMSPGTTELVLERLNHPVAVRVAVVVVPKAEGKRVSSSRQVRGAPRRTLTLPGWDQL